MEIVAHPVGALWNVNDRTVEIGACSNRLDCGLEGRLIVGSTISLCTKLANVERSVRGRSQRPDTPLEGIVRPPSPMAPPLVYVPEVGGAATEKWVASMTPTTGQVALIVPATEPVTPAIMARA